MTDKTYRDLGADAAPADTNLIATQAPSPSTAEPTRSTLAQFRARMQAGLAAVAASGAYADLSGLPSLGSLAALSAIGTANITDAAVTLAKLANLAQDTLIGRSTASTGVPQTVACTAAGRALIDDADATAQRVTLGLGTIATQAASNVAISGGDITGTNHRLFDTNKTGSFTFALADAGNVMACDHATVAIVGTIPPNSSVGFGVGTILYIEQRGAAAASFAAGVGVTLNKPSDRTLFARSQYSVICARKTGTDAWTVFGALGT